MSKDTVCSMKLSGSLSFNENDFGNDEMTTTTTNSSDKSTGDVKEKAAEKVVGEEAVGEITTEPRTYSRIRKTPVSYGYNEYAEKVTPVRRLYEVEEPSTMNEVRANKHSKEWIAVVDSEYNSLIENKTWKLVEIPPGRKAIDCKWVFRAKHDLEESQSKTFQSTFGCRRVCSKVWDRL